MKRLVYYLIFLLALVMMLLCSSACRSPKTMTYNQATTDSINLSFKDSTSQRFEFTFDSLELWGNPEFSNLENKELGNSQPQTLSKFLSSSISKFHHAVIYGGKLNTEQSKTISQDSIHNKSSTQEQYSEVQNYRVSVIPYGIAITITILLIFFFYKKRKGCAKI